MLKLQFFGSLGASWHPAGGSAEPIRLTARPGGLLAYLALARGQFFTRGELMATLWGESHDSSTVGCFNTTLCSTRCTITGTPWSDAARVAARCSSIEPACLSHELHLSPPLVRLPHAHWRCSKPLGLDVGRVGVACCMRDEVCWLMRPFRPRRGVPSRHLLNSTSDLKRLAGSPNTVTPPVPSTVTIAIGA